MTDRERQANGQTECFNIVYIKHLCSIFITLGLLIEKRYLPVCQLIDRRVCACVCGYCVCFYMCVQEYTCMPIKTD